jgi:hypothetical protein
MAKPIKITPVLRGRDAVNFLSKIKINKHQNSTSSTRRTEVRQDAAAFKSLFKKA